MARALNGSQLIRDIYGPGPDPTVRHVIRRLIWQFTRSSYLKPQEEETKQNSIRYLRAVLAHTRSAHKHRDVFQTALHTDLIPLSCIPAFKIHMHGGLRLRRNTGNTSVLNHEGEPMDITKATCKLSNSYAGERLNFSHTESESKKTETAHILSETRDKSTSTCADNSINE